MRNFECVLSRLAAHRGLLARSLAFFVAMWLLMAGAAAWAQEKQLEAANGDQPIVTFNKHIAPIVFQHCAACHRPGEVAPFSLLSYADVKKRAKQIQAVTTQRYMPPWKSVEGHGRFIGERRLSDGDIQLIAQWVQQGSAEGEPGDLPPLPKFADGWQLGAPDLIVTMPQPYEIPADGPDIYRNFVFALEIPQGKYIKAAEYRPGNRRVVHHAALAIDATGNARRQDDADPLPGFKGGLNIPGQLFPGSMAAWTPGRDPLPLPDGLSMPWKPGAGLILQLHLHPSGKPETEQSSIGFYLTVEPPRRSMVDVMLIDRRIDIPPGDAAYRTQDEFTLPIDAEALGLFPHMHMIGREMKITAHPPQGEPFSLLWINDWDFNWQNFYQYAEPVKLPAGTRIVMQAVHDNSADNFRNPNHPPQRVVWGEQTVDEMSAAVLQLVPVREADMSKISAGPRNRVVGGITAAAGNTPAVDGNSAESVTAAVKQALEKFDANRDGKLNLEELAAASGKDKKTIARLAAPFDIDEDGSLNATELARAIQALGRN